MKRTAKIKKNLSTAQELLDKKKSKVKQLEKEIAYVEMRKATGTENKFTLIEMLNKKHNTNSFSEQEMVVTAGGAIYGE